MLTFLTEPVPHEEAMRLIADKPAVTREVFDRLAEELRGRAFVITGIEDMDVVQAVRDEIATIPAGADWNKVKKEVAARISPWFTEEAALARAELIISHHAFAAYSAAQARIMDEMIDVFPFRQYLTTGDEKVRASHAALHEIILPADHPFWIYHTPPWEWGCRCQVIELTEEDRDEEYARDKKRKPEERRVLEGTALKQLDQGSLNRGPSVNVDVRTPKERGGTYQWSAQETTLPYEEIKTRWEPEVAEMFETWAGKQEIGEGNLLMTLVGPLKRLPENLAEMARALPASVPPSHLATLLKAEPAHELAKAVKLWGDDEKRFTELMQEETPEAKGWRNTMASLLQKITPVAHEPVLYRGWSFDTAEKLEKFMEGCEKGFVQKRVGMSASLDPSVVERDKFSGGPHSMIWRIINTRRAVDARPLFEAVGAVAHLEKEEEIIFPAGGIYKWQDRDGVDIEVQDSSGKTRTTRLFTLQEEIL